MRFVTLNDGTPDGRLHIVAQNGARAEPAQNVRTMQEALEHWDSHAAGWAQQAQALDQSPDHGTPVSAADMLAPLPRAWQWLDGSAFETHALLLQQAWGQPVTGLSDRPLMYQGMSNQFLAPTEAAHFPSPKDGVDFEGEFGVILDHVPMGTPVEEAGTYIRLIVLINDWSLRAFGPIEMAAGFGWMHSKPACSIAPFAVTPDALGDAWRDSRVCLPLTVTRSGTVFGQANGREMKFGFDALIAHAAYSRDLVAGTIIGSGTVANAGYAEVGSSCIAERRAIELIASGESQTPFLSDGEVVEMSAQTDDGHDLFGPLATPVRIG